MSQTARRTTVTSFATKSRPSQDLATVKKQAGQFPSVGMTLHSYKYDPRDYHGRPNAKGAVVRPKLSRRLGRKVTLKRVVLSLTMIVVLVGLWVGGTFIYNAHKLFGGSIFGFLHSTKLKGEDVGRVNILLAGNSADDVGHDGGRLTDSIMVLSIDTKSNKAFMLSIPRDLWVDIGDYGHSKINASYVYGEDEGFSQAGYPSGGMGQLEQVIEQNFGLSINYYALIDYNALRDAVNAVGGIDINIKSSDPRGIYDPSIDYATNGPLVKLSNGTHHLNGQEALGLARARGDDPRSYGFDASDFDRTMHQRQMLVAIKSKAISAGVITNPAKLTSLSNAFGNNVKTDMTLSEFRRLYDLIKPINDSNLQSLSLNDVNGTNLLASCGSSCGGQSALIPADGLDDFDSIQAYINRLTSNNQVVQENATVVVLNATDSDGLASKQATLLKNKDINVTDVGDAKNNQPATIIIDNSKGKKPATLKELVQIYGNHVTEANPYKNTYDADFIVLLGSDQAKATVGSNQ